MNPRPPEIPPHKLIARLREFDLLPAIIFMPTRRKCDESALEVANDRSQRTDQAKFEARRAMFEEFAVENPEVQAHKHSKILVNAGIASHHAGHIPPWKLLIEKMMSAGILNAIFATSTVAAGVDFPARTVVISNADTRSNDGWRSFTANELQQMTGRAGRRGKDKVGFVVLAPGQFQDPRKIAELLKAPPDALESQFRATYTSLLNLVDAFKDFGHVRDIAQRSYAYTRPRRQLDQLENERAAMVRSVTAELERSGSGMTFHDVAGFERLAAARSRMHAAVPATRAESRLIWLRESVIPGRVVSKGRGGKHFFFTISINGDKVSVLREDGRGATLAMSEIGRVFRNVYPLKEGSIERAFTEIYGRENPVLQETRPKDDRSPADAADSVFEETIARFAGNGDGSESRLALLWSLSKKAAEIRRRDRDIEHLHDRIWQPFERRAKVLDHFGYLDFRGESVTESGKWLADVRVDRTLLVGEAIRRGSLAGLTPPAAAGLVAALAADSDRNYGDITLSDELMDAVNDFEEIIYDVSRVEWKYGIEPSEEINLSAAGAAERWAEGATWRSLVHRTQAEEGDLFRLLSRTGEALMQVAKLTSSQPAAAATASRAAAEALLRDPVRG